MKRTEIVDSQITKKLLKALKESAFANCRTVAEEICFILESHCFKQPQRVFKTQKIHAPIFRAQQESGPEAQEPEQQPEQSEIDAAIEQARLSGMSEGQIKAARLISATDAQFIDNLKADREEAQTK